MNEKTERQCNLNYIYKRLSIGRDGATVTGIILIFFLFAFHLEYEDKILFKQRDSHIEILLRMNK